jgi:hypothetical protein
MDLKTEREILKKEIDQVNDVRLLEAIRKILDFGRSKSGKGYQPMSEDEYFGRITESRKAIAEGKLIVQEEAIEYFRRKNG